MINYNRIEKSEAKSRYYTNHYLISDDDGIAEIVMTRKRDNYTIVAIIDVDDVERCKMFSWYPHHDPNKPEHMIYVRSGEMRLHRFILKLKECNDVVDHLNRNPLDNRKSNLRLCSVYENNQNIGMCRRNKSGVKGVSFERGRGVWLASIMINGRSVTKRCKSFEDACNVRRDMEKLKQTSEFNDYPEKE